MGDFHELKERAGKEYASKNYRAAIALYEDAISAAQGDKSLLKIIYSNRSACHCQLRDGSAALLDAEQCIKQDPNWARGWVRKGDAFYEMRKFVEAYNAYNSAARLDPQDKSIQQKQERAQSAIASSSSSSASSSGRGGGWQPSSSNTSPSRSHVPANGLLGKVQDACSIALLSLAFLYLIPFFGNSFTFTCWRGMHTASIISRLISLQTRYGMPRFKMEYAATILPDPITGYLFLSLLLVMSRPYFLACAPLVLVELNRYIPDIFSYFQAHLPEMEHRIRPLLTQYAPQLHGQDLSFLFSQQQVNRVQDQFLNYAAIIEVWQGIFLVVECILPSRNILFMYIYWNYLSMRYMMDKTGMVKSAFLQVDAKISSLLSHRLCPAILRQGYSLVKDFLAKQVKPPQAGGPERPSMLSKCNIM